MANPDPNLRPDLRRERERHAGPLIGMALLAIFVVALLFWWMMDSATDTSSAADPTVGQDVAPSAAAGEGATDLPDPIDPEVVTPKPAPDLTPAPDAAGGTTGGTGSTP